MAPLTVSRLDVVLDRLVTVCAGATAAQKVQVIDGPYVGELAADILLLGLPDGAQPGYRSTVTKQQGYGRPRLTEEWDVHCMLQLTTGTNDVAGLRSRAVVVLGLIDHALREQARVEDTWDRAGVAGQLDWVPLLGQAGASVTVLFNLTGAALL